MIPTMWLPCLTGYPGFGAGGSGTNEVVVSPRAVPVGQGPLQYAPFRGRGVTSLPTMMEALEQAAIGGSACLNPPSRPAWPPTVASRRRMI
jgi:hypothetical protein